MQDAEVVVKQASEEVAGFVIAKGLLAVPVGIVLSEPEEAVVAQANAGAEQV